MAKKADHMTDRKSIAKFDQIINIGPAMSRDFEQLGIRKPKNLIGKNPVQLYRKLCQINNRFYDPCVLDVFMATVDYMNGSHPKQWWDYTPQRKQQFAGEVEKLRNRYSR